MDRCIRCGEDFDREAGEVSCPSCTADRRGTGTDSGSLYDLSGPDWIVRLDELQNGGGDVQINISDRD